MLLNATPLHIVHPGVCFTSIDLNDEDFHIPIYCPPQKMPAVNIPG